MKPLRKRNWRAGLVLWGVLAVWAVPSAQGAYDGTGTFTKITSRAELTDGYYVIASSNGLAAMSHTNAGTYFTSNAISPSADVLTDPSPAIVWLIQTNAIYGGHTLFNEASNRYVAYAGTANAAHSVGAVNGTTGVWTFAYGVGAFDVANVAANTRLLQYNAGAPRFACYTTVQQKLALYKMESTAQTAPEFGANPGPVSTTTGVEVVFTVTATGSPEPGLALEDTTASGGYNFTAGTGELRYTPPPADADTTKTFTFTASNSAGVATQTVSVTVVDAVVAPAFTSGTSYGATTLVAMAFTVTASGNPEPTLALQSQTASSGFSFTPATGILDYTPPTNDAGMRTFTFTASNSAGAATQAVTVTVSSPPVTIPAVSVTNIGTHSFTVNWTACDGATDYQVQIATDTNFTAGGGANRMTNPGFETGDSTGWDKFETEYAVVSTDPQEGTYHAAITATATRDLTQNVAITGDGATEYEISYWYKGSGNARIWASWTAGGQVSGDNLQPGSYNPSASEWTKMAYTVVPQSGANTLFYEIRTYNGASMQYDNFFAGEAGGGAGGSLVVDETLTALTYAATGLDMETAYYVRARQTGGEWSSVVTATTAGSEASVPVFTGGAGPFDITAGDLLDFTVSAIGTPTPVLALSGASANPDDYAFEPATGDFLYQPPLGAGGTAQTFTFTASNTEGVATQVVTVNVAAATAPLFGSNPGPLTATTGVARSFTVSATGAPDPVLALQSSTASGGSYVFTAATGLLEYTPPTNDLGARSFTFTASNIAGVATQQVNVSVSNAPALPTIDALPSLTIEAGQTSNLWVVARETDGDLITLVASNLPANATFTTVTGTGAVSNQFSFSPSSNQAGQAYAVVFYADDADGTNSATLNITVPSNDPWADYYASCYTNGVLKTGIDLKNALHDIIDGHTSFSYAATENILKDIDECPTNSTMVQLLYLQHGRAKSNFGGSEGQWNREHVWANSHGINDSLPAYSDVHHLHPTDVSVNSTRGNKDFDTVSGLSNTYSYSSTAFEPPDAGKGDVARALFYMAVRYDGSDGVGNLELTNAIPTSGAWHGKLDTLMDWNELDPVNDYEIRRNDLIYSNYQGNRNPFVDHPEWVRVVFDTNYVAAPPPPAVFAADASGTGQIDLAFTLNGRGDDVIIVWDEDGTFSAPSGAAPAVGQSFAGGTVLYKGGVSPQSHTGLTACLTRHYACWSVSGTNYSEAALTDSAVTPGPEAPAAVWVSVTNTIDFTAAWSGVGGVSDYRLDVSTGPGFTGAGDGWSTVFRETMGTSAGTTTLAAHEAADGFDNNAYTMTDGGAENPADIRTSSPSAGYTDPAGIPASSNANVYFTASGVTNLGFAIEGIDTRGVEALRLSFGYRKEDAAANMTLGVDWSTNGGVAWNAMVISNLPAEGAATGWYMVSNLAVSAAALESTNLSLRWTKTGGTAGRIDDVLLQGYQTEALFVPGYSNRTVSGATSAVVTGLTAGATYYFRVASEPNCETQYSPVGSVTTLESLAAPAFDANPGPFSTTVGVQVAFTVSASGSPAPVLALETTDAVEASYSFDPQTGQLAYTPSLAEIGERFFTFTASNTQGVATQTVAVTVHDWPAEAPIFTSGTSHGATTGVAMAFTVTATGYPEPVLALADTTATGGYSFTPATGQLAYTPPEGDAGSPTFTFTAGNSQGVATQTVTVTVTAGIPSPPASLWAAVTNATDFTAEWTVAAIATGYRLDVSPEPDFQASGGESVQLVLATNAATSPDLLVEGWSGADLGGSTYLILTQATSEVTSPAFSAAGLTNLTVDFQARTYGGTSFSNITVSISTNDGADWSAMGVVAPTDSTLRAMATLTTTSHLGGSQTRIRWASLDANGTVGVGVRYLAVKGWSAGSTPAYVPGYSNRAVSATSESVTGLVENTPYYFRVRAENAAGTSADSPTASVMTKETQPQDQAIDFPEIGAQIATNVLTLLATASSGLPVTFAVAGGPGVVEGSTLAFTGAGDVAVVASQGGNEDWNPAPDVTNLLTVSKAQAVVILGSLSPVYDGTPKSATATTEPAGLTVEFTYDGDPTAPTAAGSYAVTGTVNDALYQGSATGTLLIAESLTPFQLWVRDEQGQSLSDSNFVESADYDGDGATTEEEYLADTDPANATSVLELDGTYVNKVQAGGETGEMLFTFPASSARYYQLIYSDNLSEALTNNLGWGVPDMVVTSTVPGTWYGTIRVLLDDPAK